MAETSAYESTHALQPNDHFVREEGIEFAGRHLIVDLWAAHHLDDLERMELALRRCVEVSGATLLHIHLHPFESGGGISGVAVLAESHICVHSWPERGYAAFDVFMCGNADPEATIAVLEEAFRPGRVVVGRHRRGLMLGPEEV